MISKTDKILITGASGLVGTNLLKELVKNGYEVMGLDSKNDLRSFDLTARIFSNFKPSIVFHLAAKVGGIHANSNYKADFYSDNVLINTNIVNACLKYGTNYIFAMGTGCAYPKRLENHILYEKDFLDGIPEFTNDAYAYAKRGLLVHLNSLAESQSLCFTYCIPANIYGPYDNFHQLNSHVVPGLIRRFCDSVIDKKEEIFIWGDGSAKRDFLYIDDCVDAIIKLANLKYQGAVNVSSKNLTSIKDLANLINLESGFKGLIKYDTSKLTGQKQRIMDSSIMDKLCWSPKFELKNGIKRTVKWFIENRSHIRER
tara:strand:+ start:2300 stop:3241 length:942 start_codon:yes stop_codon:yes gene_type:complete